MPPRKRKPTNEELEARLTVFPECGQPTKSGAACRAPANVTTPVGMRCISHSGIDHETKKVWGARGARVTNLARTLAKEKAAELAAAPDLSDPKAVEAYLGKVIALVAVGALPPSVGRTINDLISTRLKVVDFELAKRLDALEEQLEEQKK